MAEPLPWVEESRYARFELISWWDQARLRQARVLVAGAGALGNELLKNLALLGVGQVTVVDMDRVELSNLSRSVLFRAEDAGRPKAAVAAARARDLNPDLEVLPLCANLLSGVGLGHVRAADVILGGLDNREARLHLSRTCNLLGKPWVDGALDVLAGTVKVFLPDGGACYECTLSEADWAILDQRRACSLLPRELRPRQAPVPTTPTTASAVAGLQVAEALKLLHGLPGLRNEGFVFDGQGYDCYKVAYRRDPDCYGHERFDAVVPWPEGSWRSTVAEAAAVARVLAGPDARLSAARELVAAVRCHACGGGHAWRGALEDLDPGLGPCPACGAPCAPEVYHDLGAADGDATLASLGIPAWDILRCRAGGRLIGLELAGDAPGREEPGRSS